VAMTSAYRVMGYSARPSPSATLTAQ